MVVAIILIRSSLWSLFVNNIMPPSPFRIMEVSSNIHILLICFQVFIYHFFQPCPLQHTLSDNMHLVMKPIFTLQSKASSQTMTIEWIIPMILTSPLWLLSSSVFISFSMQDLETRGILCWGNHTGHRLHGQLLLSIRPSRADPSMAEVAVMQEQDDLAHWPRDMLPYTSLMTLQRVGGLLNPGPASLILVLQSWSRYVYFHFLL